jgi:hypothetical protein
MGGEGGREHGHEHGLGDRGGAIAGTPPVVWHNLDTEYPHWGDRTAHTGDATTNLPKTAASTATPPAKTAAKIAATVAARAIAPHDLGWLNLGWLNLGWLKRGLRVAPGIAAGIATQGQGAIVEKIGAQYFDL